MPARLRKFIDKMIFKLDLPIPMTGERYSLDCFYPSRAEIEAAWKRGEAPPFGRCNACNAVRPLELDGTCCECGAKSPLAPEFHCKVNGRWTKATAEGET